MSRHTALGDDDLGELDYDYIIPPDTPTWLRAVCFLVVMGFAALGFWCIYLRLFV